MGLNTGLLPLEDTTADSFYSNIILAASAHALAVLGIGVSQTRRHDAAIWISCEKLELT